MANYGEQLITALDTTVTLRLITVLEDIEGANDPQHIPFYEAVLKMLSFMLTEDEWAKLNTRVAPRDWLDTMGMSLDD